MPYPCIWFDSPPEGPWRPGWCFPLGYSLSKAYLAMPEPRRPPISVCVPLRGDEAWEANNEGKRGTVFCVDAHPTDNPEGGWTVTLAGSMIHGEELLLTVHPSLNAVGIYHGFVTDGVLTGDIG